MPNISSDYANNRDMKSQKANEFIDECLNHLVCEMSDHAKWQLRASMTHAAVLAEQEAEERVRVEVTRWNSPDSMPMQKGVLAKLNSGDYCVVVKDLRGKLRGLPGYLRNPQVLGWREIHEQQP